VRLIPPTMGKRNATPEKERQNTMSPITTTVPFAAAMLACMEFGRYLRKHRTRRDPFESGSGFAIVQGTVFSLYGLLIAFTFSGAPARFDARRQLIAQEANAISTAWMLPDLLPTDSQPAIRALFRKYVDVRVEVTRMAVTEVASSKVANISLIQKEIWTACVGSTRFSGADPDSARLLLPALNTMMDISTTRAMAAMIHPPFVIFVLLSLLALVCSILTGYGMGAVGKGVGCTSCICVPAWIEVSGGCIVSGCKKPSRAVVLFALRPGTLFP
jgi:hypothetical protein